MYGDIEGVGIPMHDRDVTEAARQLAEIKKADPGAFGTVHHVITTYHQKAKRKKKDEKAPKGA